MGNSDDRDVFRELSAQGALDNGIGLVICKANARQHEDLDSYKNND